MAGSVARFSRWEHQLCQRTPTERFEISGFGRLNGGAAGLDWVGVVGQLQSVIGRKRLLICSDKQKTLTQR